MREWPEFSLIEDFPLKETVLAAKLGIRPEDLQGIKTEEIDVFETLTEGLHQIALEQRAWKVTCVDRENKEKVLWVAQGFNSSDLVTWGLQVSQLGAVANLAEEPVGPEGETPMVLRIRNIDRVQDKRLPAEKTLTILLENPQQKRGLISIREAEILYQNEVIGRANMTMSRLSPETLSAESENRLRDPQKVAAIIQSELAQYPEAHKLAATCVPGFGKSLQITDRRQISDREQIGFVKIPAELFLGHFEGFPIIPLAGIAKPGTWCVLMDYVQKTSSSGDFFDFSKLGEIKVVNPVLPEDSLRYSIKKLSDDTYSINVYFLDQKGKEVLSTSFEEIVIPSVEHYHRLWDSKAVSEAFEKQKTIKKYQEHLAILRSFCRSALGKIIEEKEAKGIVELDLKFNILDVGVGNAANATLQILDVLQVIKREYQEFGAVGLQVQLTITDVNGDITGKAEQTIKDYIASLADISPKEVKVRQIPRIERGKILPAEYAESIGPQDVIVANFALDYNNLRASIKDLRKRVKRGGQVVLGLVNKNPPYKKAMNAVTTSMQKLGDLTHFSSYRIMGYVGVEMEKIGYFSQADCEYTTYQDVTTLLEEAGFEILAIHLDTFFGIGKVIRAKYKG